MKKIGLIIISSMIVVGCASSDYDKFAYSSTDSMPPMNKPSDLFTPLNDSNNYQDNKTTVYIQKENTIFYQNLDLNSNYSEASKIIKTNSEFLVSNPNSVITLVSFNGVDSNKRKDIKLQENRLKNLKQIFINNGVNLNQIKTQTNQTAIGNNNRIDITYSKDDTDDILSGYHFMGKGQIPIVNSKKDIISVKGD